VFQSLQESNKPTQNNAKSDSVLSSSFKALTEDDMKNLYFGDFMKSKDETRLYEEIRDLDKLKEVIILRDKLLSMEKFIQFGEKKY
jgi:hypothetical protein